MATLETESTLAETPPEDTPTSRLRAAFDRLSNQQKIVLAVALAAVVSLVIWGALMSRQPDYKTLFANLSERDGGAIITALEQLNVPYKFTEGSGAIQVPTARVHEIRLRLASQGLPKGGSVGFEIMEGQKFGTSQFVEQVNFQRALEGELARTIQSISAVQTARVHLAIPKASAFIREEHKPTASVLLNLYPGRSLEPSQVAGISHLIASSVPQLPLSGVSIIDQNGRLLSELKSKLTEAGLDPNQIKYVHEIQNDIVRRIEKILTPIVGAKNVQVQVAADIDFSQTEQTAEIYKPNTTPANTSIRSQQTSETANVNQPGVLGIPGALSNQPPVPATAPLTAPAVGAAPTGRAGQTLVQEPGQLNAAGVNSQIVQLGQPPFSTRQDKTTNYEVDKTIRYTKQSVGALRRVSAAVVLNYRAETDPKTGKETPVPLTEAELQQINDLVKEAMGYSQERGDTLSVANAPFTPPDTDDLNIPLWKNPEVIDFGKDLVKYLLLLGAIIYILIAVVKPIIANMFPPPPEPAEPSLADGEDADGVMGEDGEIIMGADGLPVNTAQEAYEHKVNTVKSVADNDPKVVANIIKDWLGVNG